MPLYPYRCTQCGHHFEKIQSFSAEPEQECPKCGGVLERPLTVPGLQFKGAGWYVNDYPSKSNGSGDSSGAESKTETTTETKTEAKAAAGNNGAASAAPAAAPTTSGSNS